MFNDILANYRIYNPDNVDDIWKYFKESVLSATKFCGWSKKGRWRQQTWWWDNWANFGYFKMHSYCTKTYGKCSVNVNAIHVWYHLQR